ncbi:O-methyltransferase [Sutcliffiella rhizosphaerae]|uniref:Catechol O-methyltransferase n=1 Tax=Sutcliffiella rhizosphaerae TaxID=2880967 RepID=A0ABM8YMN9_9BACI|nr:O-methyltransferase [Sutcliffiella rhizosphaerae]CAG9621252.1 Catechol O-methyltransferase [Sutcliffiella rhizosphaerae]
MENTWSKVDDYIQRKTQSRDEDLQHVLDHNREQGLPAIDVSPNEAKFLYTLAKMKDAKRILEIGTLGGFSTIWLAKAVQPEGKVITLEINPHHAEVAKANLQNTSLDHLVEIKLGSAHASLEELIVSKEEPFDFVFIDADKESCVPYFQAVLKLSKRGTVIVTDNVIRNGELINKESKDTGVAGVRALFDHLATLDHVSSTSLQTVGSKGYDGFSISIVE